MRRNPSSRLRLAIERTLFAIGVACLAWYGWTMFRIHRLQSEASATVARMIAGRPLRTPVEPSLMPWHTDLIGRIDIPRIHLSAVVMEGDDESVLDFAVGHVAQTPPPWRPGNSAFAAHRDRLFRPLKGIRVGDDIWVATWRGEFRYRVRRTLIVNPADVWVLDPIPEVGLTLITCFPFYYVGNAPQRFIVQAERIGDPAP